MQTIILLGPSKAGKSTVGRLLAAATDRPFHQLQAFNTDAFTQAGVTEEALHAAWSQGFDHWHQMIQPLVPAVLRSFINQHPGAVLELDALLLALDDPQVRDEMMALLAPAERVLLLPAPDAATSLRVVRERQRILYNGLDLNYYFVTHPANDALAKHVVYTKDKTPQQTADEVYALATPNSPIVLIGPMNAGKSTVGQHIAQQHGLKSASLDQHRWRYYEECGFTRDEMRRRDEDHGAQGVIDYWKLFDVHAVDRFLEEHTEGVLDFGAGHSVYDNPADLAAVRARLEPYPNVILVMPSPDPEESFAILTQRSHLKLGGIEATEYLLRNALLQRYAHNRVLYRGAYARGNGAAGY